MLANIKGSVSTTRRLTESDIRHPSIDPCMFVILSVAARRVAGHDERVEWCAKHGIHSLTKEDPVAIAASVPKLGVPFAVVVPFVVVVAAPAARD